MQYGILFLPVGKFFPHFYFRDVQELFLQQNSTQEVRYDSLACLSDVK